MTTAKTLVVDQLRVSIHPTAAQASTAAAMEVAETLRKLATRRAVLRVIVASAPSQEEMVTRLLRAPGIDWHRVVVFHMDEYVGLPDNAPQSFARWVRERFAGVNLGGLHLMRPGADPDGEAARYGALITQGPIDLTCFGIGANGHIAFNEPNAAFDQPEAARSVELSHASRRQQVEEGLFDSLSAVPTHAVTLTIPTLLSATSAIGTVLGQHKASAVARTLSGPIGPDCPATSLRLHPDASLHLDAEAAAQLA